jgi:hypothetical protein
MRVVILSVLLLVTNFSVAAEWQPLNTQSTQFPIIVEVDTTSIRTRGLLLEATFRFTHPQTQINKTSGEKFLSAEVQGLFDCELKTFVPFHRIEYSEAYGKGGIVGTHVVQKSQIQLRPITVGSMNEFMLTHVCMLENAIRSTK